MNEEDAKEYVMGILDEVHPNYDHISQEEINTMLKALGCPEKNPEQDHECDRDSCVVADVNGWDCDKCQREQAEYSEARMETEEQIIQLRKYARDLLKKINQKNNDKVSMGVLEQVMWERDVAEEQLHELGYELGEKIRHEDTISRQRLLNKYLHLGDIYEGMSEEEIHDAEIYGRFIADIETAPTAVQEPGWINVSDRLPREALNPVTNDFYEYPVTFRNGDVYDVRHYKFGKGHWWHGLEVMDNYVTAWLPLPDPHKEEEGGSMIKENATIYVIMACTKLEEVKDKTGQSTGWADYGDSHIPGYYTDYYTCVKYVINNAADIWETCYDYVCIEKVEEGLAMPGKLMGWYKYNKETGKYDPIEQPEFDKKFGGRTIG